ncbi:hypothetical protein AAEX28_10360 [Lentisphaerota bacterium WC36G]|nr:hypothetical protein LJT99_13200 [Lentisphaerae bacterium WC36]
MKAQAKWWKGAVVAISGIFVIATFIFVNSRNKIFRNSFFDGFRPTSILEEIIEEEIDSNLTDDEKFFIYGDYSQEKEVDQQKAILDKFPNDKMLLANYINHLKFDEIDSEKLLKILQDAEKKDPENAFYNYLQAYVYFRDGVKLIKDESSKNKCEGKKTFEKILQGECPSYKELKQSNYKVVDEGKLQQGIVQFYQGISKPYLKTYSTELHRKRMKMKYKVIDSLGKSLNKIADDAGLLMPYFGKFRENIYVMAWYAHQQYKNNNPKSAKKLFAEGDKFLKQFNENTNGSLIQPLVVICCSTILYRGEACYYNEIGDIKNKSLTIKKLKLVNDIKNSFSSDRIAKFEKKYGLIGAMIVPSVSNNLTEEQFAQEISYERNLWYKLFDIVTETFLTCVILIAVVIFSAVALIAALLNKKSCTIFRANFSEHLYIAWWSLILPLGVYLLLLNIDALNGRDYALGVYNYFSLVMQKITFIWLAILPTCWTLRHFVRKWCSKNSIDVVPKNNFFNTNIALITVALICLSLQFFSSALGIETVKQATDALKIVGVIMGIYLISLLLWWILYSVALYREHQEYKRLYWINLAPYLAVVAAVMIGAVLAIDIALFKYYFAKDKYILTKNLENELTKFEVDVAKDAQKKLEALFAK